MTNYGDPEYWEKRYSEQQGKSFDWLEDYDSLKGIINNLVGHDSRIIVLGCGNADLSEEMYEDGYHYIDNIDISSVVIQQMSERNKEKKLMTWQVMNVMDLKFEGCYFDLAIDKSTIDALLCGDNAEYNVAKMTKEVQRVLKVGGIYMVISYGVPDSRLEHFNTKHLDWDVRVIALNEDTQNIHYVYLCTKRQDADITSANNWADVEFALLHGNELKDIKNTD